MNVFDVIKGSILSVPKDISSGIRSLTTRDSVTELSTDSEADVDAGSHEVNMHAGSELLSKFQSSWSEIHQNSEENSKKAKVADEHIGELFMYLERQNDAVNQFLIEISTLPQLLVDLKMAVQRIEGLEGQFEVVESELLKLEDACETQELRRNQRHHEYQLQMYQQKSSTELEQQKVRMARDHATKVQRYEYHLQKTLREKQQAFEATFREEMQHYKKFGKTSPLFTKQTAARRSADLANFCPDGDDSALDEFLQIEGASEVIADTTTDDGTSERGSELSSTCDNQQVTSVSNQDHPRTNLPALDIPPPQPERQSTNSAVAIPPSQPEEHSTNSALDIPPPQPEGQSTNSAAAIPPSQPEEHSTNSAAAIPPPQPEGQSTNSATKTSGSRVSGASSHDTPNPPGSDENNHERSSSDTPGPPGSNEHSHKRSSSDTPGPPGSDENNHERSSSKATQHVKNPDFPPESSALSGDESSSVAVSIDASSIIDSENQNKPT